MLSINAISIGPRVFQWLASTYHPRILYVFDHACNLINERRDVLSIVTPQIGNGPFNLVIPSLWKSFTGFSDHLEAHFAISIHDAKLRLGELSISTDSATLW